MYSYYWRSSWLRWRGVSACAPSFEHSSISGSFHLKLLEFCTTSRVDTVRLYRILLHIDRYDPRRKHATSIRNINANINSIAARDTHIIKPLESITGREGVWRVKCKYEHRRMTKTHITYGATGWIARSQPQRNTTIITYKAYGFEQRKNKFNSPPPAWRIISITHTHTHTHTIIERVSHTVTCCALEFSNPIHIHIHITTERKSLHYTISHHLCFVLPS
jgi:hypothetical protein